MAVLLDDDSVIEFYEDFARLAFGDSRGGVTTRCKLLKYKSREDLGPSVGVGSRGAGAGAIRRESGGGVEESGVPAATATKSTGAVVGDGVSSGASVGAKAGVKRKRPLAPALPSAGATAGGGSVGGGGLSKGGGGGAGPTGVIAGPETKGIAGEAGIDELGDREGKVECCCCWTVKRDLFDLPMMIVMNVSCSFFVPISYRMFLVF